MSLSIRYSTAQYSKLCFKHAVQEALKGADVIDQIDEDAGSDYDMRQSWCSLCCGEDDEE